jgi:glycosyltransferase involved in cell wall biosynthesis
MRIAFTWFEITDYKWRLTDGLGAALKILEQTHQIGYFEPFEHEKIHSFKPDVILHWGPLCGNDIKDVKYLPYKKAICFAGGPIDELNCDGFDLYFTESEINEKEFESFGLKWKRAFGINEEMFKPENLEKKYDGMFAGTFAKWKRPELFAKAVGSKGIAIGLHQDFEKECYEVCEQAGMEVYPDTHRSNIPSYMNQSHTVVNCANVWGGGQRLTLEAMSCNVPPIIMSDSPKNREYVEESGFGLVVDPTPEAIREAILSLKGKGIDSREYILSKFSAAIYARQLNEGLCSLF